MTATSTTGSMKQGCKFSVRLDAKHDALLETLSADIGCTLSEVLRQSLDCYAASRSPRPPAPSRQQVVSAGASQLPIVSRERPIAAPPAPPELCRTVLVKDAPSVPSAPTRPTPTVQARNAELLAQYRHFGCEIWQERNRLFQRLLAAAEVAKANNENPRDAEICAEILRLGQRFGVFN
jgi:hypothetical protein